MSRIGRPLSQAKVGPEVPSAVRPMFDEIVTAAGAFCLRHFDGEYAGLCLKLATRLAPQLSSWHPKRTQAR